MNDTHSLSHTKPAEPVVLADAAEHGLAVGDADGGLLRRAAPLAQPASGAKSAVDEGFSVHHGDAGTAYTHTGAAALAFRGIDRK